MTEIQDNIIEKALPHVAFDGWTWEVIEKAAMQAGYEKDMAHAVFPGGLGDAVSHFSDQADRWMLERLETAAPDDMRVRDRIALAVKTRLDTLLPHKEAVKLSLAYWAVPPRSLRAGKIVWKTADRMWEWAGDTSTDYNRYTKRSLLSGILGATTLVWLDDDSADQQTTHEFLGRRIENVMQLGRFLGKIGSR